MTIDAEKKVTLEELETRLNIVGSRLQVLEMKVPDRLHTRIWELESGMEDLKMWSKVAACYACIGIFVWQSSKITRLQRELEEEVEVA